MLVEKNGDPDFAKVLDFGIAKVPIGEAATDHAPSSKNITKAGMVFGTPEYMPPEQALGQDVDERADLYSLGVITYEMLAGRRPFVAESQVAVLGKQLSREAPSVRGARAGYVSSGARGAFRAAVARTRTEGSSANRAASDRRNRSAPRVRHVARAHPDAAPRFAPEQPRADELSRRATTMTICRPALCNRHPRVSEPARARGKLRTLRRAALPPPLRRLPAPVLVSAPLGLAGLVVGFVLVTAFVESPRVSRRDRGRFGVRGRSRNGRRRHRPPSPPAAAPAFATASQNELDRQRERRRPGRAGHARAKVPERRRRAYGRERRVFEKEGRRGSQCRRSPKRSLSTRA